MYKPTGKSKPESTLLNNLIRIDVQVAVQNREIIAQIYQNGKP